MIVAHGLVAQGSDQDQLAPMIDAVEAAAGRLPDEISADSGCCSEKNLEMLENRGIRGHVATGRQKHGTGNGSVQALRSVGQLSRGRDASAEAGRSAKPLPIARGRCGPVFGQIKQARGFRQFLLRGLEKTRHEWAVVCTARNLGKLVNTGA